MSVNASLVLFICSFNSSRGPVRIGRICVASYRDRRVSPFFFFVTFVLSALKNAYGNIGHATVFATQTFKTSSTSF